jgi:subtilase family serine protease
MRTLNVYINGIRYGSLEIPGLASWNQWQEVTMYVPLVAGANTIMVRRDKENSGQVNLDTLKVSMRPTG